MISEHPFKQPEKIAAIRALFLKRVTDLFPGARDEAEKLFAVISRPNWYFEWGLPLWIGEWLGTSREQIDEHLFSQVCLLAYARLVDDISDHEPGSLFDQAHILSLVLYHIWHEEEVLLFCKYSSAHGQGVLREKIADFLRIISDCMYQFISCPDYRFPAFSAYTENDFSQIGRRAASLKIDAAGLCLSSDRAGELPAVCALLDHILACIGMLDDCFDWEKDLAAGRYNVYTACMSDDAQIPENSEKIRESVNLRIYLGNGLREFFTVLYTRLSVCAEMADASGISGLGHFIDWLGKEVKNCDTWLSEKAAGILIDKIRDYRQDH